MATLDPDAVTLRDIMTQALVTARADATVESLIELMTLHHISCVPIVDDRERPTGIVTKLDVIECRTDPRKTARELMMPHALTLPPTASIATAAALMIREGIHHLLIVDEARALRGVLSTFDITRWVAQVAPEPS